MDGAAVLCKIAREAAIAADLGAMWKSASPAPLKPEGQQQQQQKAAAAAAACRSSRQQQEARLHQHRRLTSQTCRRPCRKQHDYYNVDASPPRMWNPSTGGRCTHGYYNDGPSKAVPPWVVAVPAFASPERHSGVQQRSSTRRSSSSSSAGCEHTSARTSACTAARSVPSG